MKNNLTKLSNFDGLNGAKKSQVQVLVELPKFYQQQHKNLKTEKGGNSPWLIKNSFMQE